MMGNMSAAQQSACLGVLQAILSAEGYTRVIGEWQADDPNAVFEASAAASGAGGAPGGAGRTPQAGGTPGAGGAARTPPAGGAPGAGGGGAVSFGTPYYFAAIIGTPSVTDPWQWQWGGHHVTVNATIVGQNIALTPSFIGVQPVQYTNTSSQTVRPLGDIEDDAFALLASLDATQQQAAVLGGSVIDLVLGPGQDGKTIQAEGLPASRMNATQQAALLKLIGHYTGLAAGAYAASRNAEIQANLAQTSLAWYGPTAKGNPAYFRVTGPTVVIEYSPQAVTGAGAIAAGAYHVHGIYRDPTNDYGSKFTGLKVGS